MQQYFAKDKNLNLEQSDYHHIKNVMRMKINDVIKVVFDNTIYICKIKEIKNDVKFDILDKIKINNSSVEISIMFSLIKEQKLDYLLQKSTELGVNTLIPITTKRTVIKIDKSKINSKLSRWKKIVKEASEQSFRSYIPDILDVKNIKEFDFSSYDLKLLCSLNKNSKNIKKVLQKNNKYDKILLVFGPEGGFDPKEEEYLVDNGFISVTLGDNVLRSETAPVAALSMINYEFMR